MVLPSSHMSLKKIKTYKEKKTTEKEPTKNLQHSPDSMGRQMPLSNSKINSWRHTRMLGY